MADEKEYLVVTKKGIDIAEIEQDLERDTTSDGSVSDSIPGRTVDVKYAKKANDRITHYMMTDAEAAKLSEDPRIHAVEMKPPAESRFLFATQTAQFDRSTSNDQDAVNWGLRRHIIKEFDSATAVNTYTGDYNYTVDGTGVDIVIQDDGIEPAESETYNCHPSWRDAEGNSRFVKLDWNTIISGCMPASHYTNAYSDGNNAGQHGSHVAGIAAGYDYGWAKNAKIYSVRVFGGTAALNSNDIYDVIRLWHINKPIDPATGYRRPTIVNQSWGYGWYYDDGLGKQVKTLFYQGVDQSITPQVWSSGTFTQWGAINSRHPNVNTAADVEQEQLTDTPGIICVKAAGNAYHPCAGANAPYYSDIYNSYYTLDTANQLGVPADTPIYYNRPSSPHSDNTLWVANMDRVQYGTEEFIRQDSERGPRIDIMAAGDDITSATSSISGYGGVQTHPDSFGAYKIARIGGTSMAAPQITGIGALWLQLNPGGTAQQFKDFLTKNSTANSYDTGTTTDFSAYNTIPRRYGAPNRILYWPYNSKNPIRYSGTSGNSTPGIG